VDMEIHKAIARAAHSKRLMDAMLAVRSELFIPVDQTLTDGRQEEVHRTHEGILAAIRDRDPLRAAAEMEKHIHYIRGQVQRALERVGASVGSTG